MFRFFYNDGCSYGRGEDCDLGVRIRDKCLEWWGG